MFLTVDRTGRPGVWLLGIGLIVVGVLFLLDNAGALDIGDFFSTFWPLLLIGWGTWMLVREGGRSLWGLIVLLLGVGFQAEELGWIESGWLGRFWPVALIIVGIAILVGARWQPRSRPATTRQVEPLPEDWTDTVAVMGDRDQRVTSRAWRGGRIVAVMGDAKVDLREATPHAEGAQLRVIAVMGDVKLRVPQEWTLSIKGSPVLGSVDDRTQPPSQRRGRAERTRTVEIVATAVLGDVEIED